MVSPPMLPLRRAAAHGEASRAERRRATRETLRWRVGRGTSERSWAPGERRYAQNPVLALLYVGALARGRLAGSKRRGRRTALLEVLVGLRLLLFLVAAHLTLGHGDLLARG